MHEDQILQLTAANILYGYVGSSLLRYSLEIKNSKLKTQVIILDSVNENEIEEYSILATEIFSQYMLDGIEEDVIKISSISELKDIKPELSVKVFCRKIT